MEASDIKRILTNYEELLDEVKKMLVFGIPVEELDRDTILVLWMWSLKSTKEEATHLEKAAELTGEIRARMESNMAERPPITSTKVKQDMEQADQ